MSISTPEPLRRNRAPRAAVAALLVFAFSLSGARAEETPAPSPQLEAVAPAAPQSPFVLAPEVVVALPQPIMLGLEAHLREQPDLRAFLETGYFRFPFFGSNDHSLSAMTIQAGLRYFPFSPEGHGFYVAPSLGFRHIAFSRAFGSPFQLDDSVSVNDGAILASTFYLGAAVGATVRLSKHLFWSFDLGVQLALAGSGGLDLESTASGLNSSNSPLLQTDSSGLDRIARLMVPQLTLFRLVWVLD